MASFIYIKKTTMLKNVWALLPLFFWFHSLQGQGIIKLVEPQSPNCFIKKNELLTLLSKHRDIDSAEQVILRYCLGRDNKISYLLFCKSCEPAKMLRFFPREAFKKNPRSFNSLSIKGDGKFYSFKEVLRFLKDSLATIDSLVLNVSEMSAADLAKVYSIRLTQLSSKKSFQFSSFTPEILVLRTKQLSETSRDYPPFQLHYMESGNKMLVKEPLHLFSLNDGEKLELRTTVEKLKLGDPAMGDKEILAYLQMVVETQYGQVDRAGLKKWYYSKK